MRKRKKLNNGDIKLTIDEKINNAILDTKDMKNDLFESHKNREKIMNKIRQYCDNMNGLFRRETVMRNSVNKTSLK